MRYVKQFVTEKTPHAILFRWIAISVTIAATILSLTLPAFAQTKYVITDGDNVIVCMSSSNDPEVVIEEAGLKLGADDTYTTLNNGGVSEIHINRIQMITIETDTETIVIGTHGGTVAAVLNASQIPFTSDDLLSCSAEDQTYDGMVIRLSETGTDVISYEEVLPYEIEYYEDSSLQPGEEVVLTEGKSGVIRYTAEVTYHNGLETGRTVIDSLILTDPVNRIVMRGVDRSVKEHDPADLGTASSAPIIEQQQLVPGTTLEYSEIWDFQATAYYCEPNAWNTTYTGTEARVGAIAVDPNFIPLGTRMYIVSADGEYIYGYCVAEDTGGAIKGKIVDLYFNTYDECVQFGRRDVKIYVLK